MEKYIIFSNTEISDISNTYNRVQVLIGKYITFKWELRVKIIDSLREYNVISGKYNNYIINDKNLIKTINWNSFINISLKNSNFEFVNSYSDLTVVGIDRVAITFYTDEDEAGNTETVYWTDLNNFIDLINDNNKLVEYIKKTANEIITSLLNLSKKRIENDNKTKENLEAQIKQLQKKLESYK